MAAALRRFVREAPAVVWFVIIWLGAEIAAAFVLPLFLPRTVYLDWYQPEQAEESVTAFLEGEHLLEPDPVAGWRSAPSRTEGPWRTDSLGARSTGRSDWTGPPELDVLFMGSSMVNGGGGVSNDETISAFVESDSVDVLNFGTMMYGADQMLLAYRSRLSELEPDVVVAGVDGDPIGPLENMWVPLRRPDEFNMPFVKPRFERSGDTLRLITVDPGNVLGPGGRDRLAGLIESDRYLERFERFVRFEQTPILAVASDFVSRVRNRLFGYRADPAAERLLDDVLDRLREEVADDGARLLVVAMPLGRGAAPAAQLVAYRNRIERWRDDGFRVVDVEEVLADAGPPEPELYLPDGVHLSVAGNEVLAAVIADSIR